MTRYNRTTLTICAAILTPGALYLSRWIMGGGLHLYHGSGM